VVAIKTTPAKLAGQLRGRNRATLQAIARGALRGAQRGRAIVVRETPVDQGQLKNAWKVEPGNKAMLLGKGLIARAVRFVNGMTLAELRNTAPHAGIVELGARPHPVSPEGIQAIADWALRNLDLGTVVGPVKRGGGGRRKMERDAREAAAMAVAQAIAWKIRKYGQEPTYFVKGCLPALHQAVEVEVSKAIEEVARRGTPNAGAP
jgi:hypothetical protein